MTTGVTTLPGRTFFSGWSLWPATPSTSSASGAHTSDEEVLSVIDGKSLTSCYKWLDRVVCLCQQPRLNLKVSPPYLLDILPDTYEKLQAIVNAYESDYERLSRIEYLQIAISSLIKHCKHTVQLFRKANENMFNPRSTARSRLIKLTLIFSHLLHDLKALFPDNKFITDFRITKPDAAKWWSQNFGNTQSIVSWPAFEIALLHSFHVDSTTQLESLRNTVDLTCNRHVSIFEFDVFTRLFQPWSNILETWKVLALLHPGYMAFMTYDQVKVVLKQYRIDPGPGSFVFRLSCTKPGQWAIGYVTNDGKILQTIIQNKPLVQALLDGERDGFYRFPNGQRSSSSLLRRLVRNQPQVRLQVTQEQYQVYSDMGSAFELCKICDENNKDVQLEPCGHLICRPCLLNCQSAGRSHNCPFCRVEIKGVEDVVLDPYNPPRSTIPCGSSNPTGSTSLQSTSQDLGLGALLGDLCIDFASPKKPPPVPPRNPSSLPPTDDFDTKVVSSQNEHNISDITALCTSHGDSQAGSFCYPKMMVSNGCCLSTSFSTKVEPQSACHEALNVAAPVVVPDVRLIDQIGNSSVEKSGLNYAQLDLIPCDSEQDLLTECDIPVDSRIPSEAHEKDWRIHSPNSISRYPFNVSDNETVPIRHLSDEFHDSSRVCGGLPSTDNMPCPSLSPVDNVDRLADYLLHKYDDMDKPAALLLLCITGNQLHMVEQIWRYFMPRS